MPINYLHNHPNFKQLIEITSLELSINEPSLVEKDYWITHCLYGLQQLGLNFELKGGTSLSKGYNIIYRFSEDIDIKIDPPFEVYTGKNQDKTKHRASRKQYFDWLTEFLNNKIDGIIEVNRDHNFDDDKYRSGGIRLSYKTQFDTIIGLKEGILLEVGFDKTTPNHNKNISSWVLDKALSKNVEVIENKAVNVCCYEPKYTFVEKLQAVVRKFKQFRELNRFPENFMRHYYDIYYLLQLKDVQEFITTKEYEEYKKERFGGDDTVIANSDAFKLQDKRELDIFKKEYSKTKSLYYKGQIELEEILSFIKNYLDKL